MKMRTLGKTGFKVSEIGLGCWQLGNDFGELTENQATDILDTASENNITLWDTADVYGAGLSEQRIGLWLKQHDKKPLVITKVGRDAALYPDGYTKEKVKQNLISSIKRLQVEALDLVQLHCVPPEVLYAGDLLAWMSDFQQQGLIKHFGASVESLQEAEFCLTQSDIASLQIIFNIFRQDATEKLFEKAANNNVGIIVRLPLASGLLSGKMSSEREFSANDHRNYNKNGEHFHVGETFNGLPLTKGVELAERLKTLLPSDLSLHQVAMRWILDQPQVSTIIAGTTKKEQVIANAQISSFPELSAELHQQLHDFYYENVRQNIRGGI
ncbi:aldo/keto reductase [Thalassotalea sp. G2M2-11]|uniref:aldo/keto reductase n=1 Tax=Thalassotalea sp. G2M2-11 TaxID=2787627 RepID=UPI0019D1B0E7|nr:aldo/keto reductase [Thalassotalea sp. G2M2-11]